MIICQKIEFDTTANIVTTPKVELFTGAGTITCSKIVFATAPTWAVDVKSSQRTFRVFIVVYFDGESATPTIFEYDDIFNFY